MNFAISQASKVEAHSIHITISKLFVDGLHNLMKTRLPIYRYRCLSAHRHTVTGNEHFIVKLKRQSETFRRPDSADPRIFRASELIS